VGSTGGFLDYLVIIGHSAGGWGRTVPLWGLAHPVSQLSTHNIEFLLAPVPQFRALDTNIHNLPYNLYHNTFFRVSGGENRLPTAAGGSVREKEFLYTTPRTYEYPVQSGTLWGDRFHPHNHNTHKRAHALIHDVQSPHRFYVVEGTYSETKRQHPHRSACYNRIH
jgi:hypothetical protein